MALNLTVKPEIMLRSATPFLYVEKIGPFLEKAPLAWQEFWANAGTKFPEKEITGKMGLSYIDAAKKGDEAYTYQAGITLKTKLSRVPRGFKYREIPGGKYASFLVTGAYSQLPAVYARIFSILPKLRLKKREDFCIESYLNNPKDTAEDKLETVILIPIF